MSHPLGGIAGHPEGMSNLNAFPSGVVSVSAYGLKSSLPENASIVVSSGEVTNACVSGFPSFRFAKLRL